MGGVRAGPTNSNSPNPMNFFAPCHPWTQSAEPYKLFGARRAARRRNKLKSPNPTSFLAYAGVSGAPTDPNRRTLRAFWPAPCRPMSRQAKKRTGFEDLGPERQKCIRVREKKQGNTGENLKIKQGSRFLARFHQGSIRVRGFCQLGLTRGRAYPQTPKGFARQLK